MKFLIVLFVVLAVAIATWAPRSREEYLQDREDCFKELKLTEATAEKIRKYNFLDDPDAMCYVRCIGIKSGTWDDINGYNVDRVYEVFTSSDMEVSKENLRSCFNPVMDASNCVWATINMRCLWDNKYIRRKDKPKA